MRSGEVRQAAKPVVVDHDQLLFDVRSTCIPTGVQT